VSLSVGGLWSVWQRFWFAPQDTSSLALFRIAFGTVAIGWTVTLIPNLFAFFGPGGILPQAPVGAAGEWDLLEISDSPVLLLAVFAATLGAAVAVTIGMYSRIAAIVLWIGITAFEHRDALTTNSGDGVMRSLALFLALAPAGAALSVDRLRTAPRRFWEFPARAPWALRLIQIQISIGYLTAVWHKAHNGLWTNGTAVSYALRMQDIHHLYTPAFITHSVPLTNLLTYGTLAIEFSLGVLIWNRAARPYVLALGVCLHLGIDSSIMIGFFSYAMLASYLAFVPPETATRAILTTRDVTVRIARQRSWARTPSPAATIPNGLGGQAFLPHQRLTHARQGPFSPLGRTRRQRSADCVSAGHLGQIQLRQRNRDVAASALREGNATL
jgi:hypothetical protein